MTAARYSSPRRRQKRPDSVDKSGRASAIVVHAVPCMCGVFAALSDEADMFLQLAAVSSARVAWHPSRAAGASFIVSLALDATDLLAEDFREENGAGAPHAGGHK